MCNDRPLPPTNIKDPIEGQIVYVRACIIKRGECGQMGIRVLQPGTDNTATLVVDAKEIRREDRERLGISA